MARRTIRVPPVLPCSPPCMARLPARTAATRFRTAALGAASKYAAIWSAHWRWISGHSPSVPWQAHIRSAESAAKCFSVAAASR